MSDHVREPVQKEMWVPVDGSAAGSLGPWVPGQRGAAPPCRTGGQDWQKPGELPAGRLRPAAVQGTETQWPAPGPPTGQAASHAPSPQRRVSAQSEAAAPGCALRQAPQQGLRAWVNRILLCENALIYIFAAAKSLQSCPTLCDPIDGSPQGSPIPGILQASLWT